MTLIDALLASIDRQLASGTLTAEQAARLRWQRQQLLEDVAAEARRILRRIERHQVHEWDIDFRHGN
jgi:hypothetical protein